MGIRLPSSDSLKTSGQVATPNLRVNANASAEAFGGGAASQSRAAGAMGEAFNVIERESDKADSLAVLEAETELARRKQAMVFDPQGGLITRKGKDAMAAVQEFDEKFGFDEEELTGKLSSERQKRLFKERAVAQRDDLQGQMMKHASVEIQAFDQELSESKLALDRDDAAKRFNEPDAIAKSIENQKQTIMEQAARLGRSDEWAQAQMQDAQSKTHLEVMDRMINAGSDLDAEAYLKTNMNALSGEDRGKAEKILAEGILLGKTQRTTDSIMNAGQSMSASLQQARSIEDPKVRRAVEDEVRQRFQLDKIAKEDAKNNMFDRSSNIIEKNGGDLTQIPRSTWMNMDQGNRQALETRSAQLKAGKMPTTDWQKYVSVQKMASDPKTRQDFIDLNPMLLRPYMADTQFLEIVRMQKELNKGGDADKLMSGFRTNMQVVQGTMKAVGIEDPEKIELFYRNVDEQVIAQQERNGRKSTSEEIQAIADNLVVKGKVPGSGWIFEDKKSVFELDDGDAIVVQYADVPVGERRKIQESLNKRGITNPSEDQITALYNGNIQRLRSKRNGI